MNSAVFQEMYIYFFNSIMEKGALALFGVGRS